MTALVQALPLAPADVQNATSRISSRDKVSSAASSSSAMMVHPKWSPKQNPVKDRPIFGLGQQIIGIAKAQVFWFQLQT